jgi:hypothetical protein
MRKGQRKYCGKKKQDRKEKILQRKENLRNIAKESLQDKVEKILENKKGNDKS